MSIHEPVGPLKFVLAAPRYAEVNGETRSVPYEDILPVNKEVWSYSKHGGPTQDKFVTIAE